MLNGRKIVSLCTSRLNDIDNIRFIMRLNKGLKEQNASLFIYNVNTDLYWSDDNIRAESAVFGLVDMRITDVVIVMYERIKNKTVTDRVIESAHRHNVPVIIVDAQREDCISICFDYQKGFEEVVRHVIEFHGAKKPHFLGGFKGNIFSDERMEVFRKVIEENGIEFTEDMVSYGNFWAKPAREATEALLAKGDIPDAIICANDIMALNVCAVLFEHGYKVPDDIIVTGFDGIDEINLSIPRMTSSYCGCAASVPSIVEALTKLFNDGVKTGSYLVEPELIVNSSCGCDNSNDELRDGIIRSFNDRFYRYQDDIRFMFDISTKIQMSKTPMEAAVCMSHPMLKGIRCFTFSSCLEQESDFFASPLLMSERSKFNTFFDSEGDMDPEHSLSADELSHQIAEIATVGLPTVINVLDYLSKPMGVICYSFENFNIVECSKTASITNTISMGLGGFITSRYQRFLFERVEEMYRIDPLTGLFNRSGFNNEFAKLSEDTDNKGRPITVIMADLDGLKFINDTYGHESGDVAIASAAKVLSDCCPEKSLCVRFGGDEMFAVMLGDCCPEKIIDKIETKLEQVNKQEHNGFPTMLSCGAYTTVLDDSFDLSSALKQADEKMYSNKRSRKNKYMNI